MCWVALVAVALDRATKRWSLTLSGAEEAVPGLLNFRPVRNYGAAFGVFSGNAALLLAVALLLCAGVLFWLFRRSDLCRPARAGLWLVLAGGLSNIFDRLRYGYVIDFLEFGFVRFPVFNVADVCIVGGCALCFIAVLFTDGRRAHG